MKSTARLFLAGALLFLLTGTNAQNASYDQNSSTPPITGTDNTAFGSGALNNITTGPNNVAVGHWALLSNTSGNHNTAIGAFSLLNNTIGFYNSAYGMNSMRNNIGGNFNVANGNTSLYSNTYGNNNSASGFESMRQNTTGNFNTASGYQSLYNNISTDNNTAMGYQALFNNLVDGNTSLGYQSGYSLTTGLGNTYIGFSSAGNNTFGYLSTGSQNSFVGNSTGYDITTGNDNCIFGFDMAYGLTTGSRNVYIGSEGGGGGFNNITGNNNTSVGYRAGLFLNTGSNNNTFLGFNSGPGGAFTLSNASAFGANALVMANNNMILGNNNVNVGIGLSGLVPQKKLEIYDNINAALPTSPNISTGPGTFGASGLRFRNLTSNTPTTPGNGKMLTVNASGDVILVTAGGLGQANNGLQVTASGIVQLGGNCVNPVEVNNAALLTNRKILLNNKDLFFSDAQGLNGRIGIGFFPNCTAPGNLLEVRTGNPSNTSALRLTDLAGQPGFAYNGRVLSVNPANGDVILTQGPVAGVGNTCSTPAPNKNYLTATWEIPMVDPSGNAFNFMFNEAGPGGRLPEVGIGHQYGQCGNLFNSKFEVISLSKHQNAGYFTNTASLPITTGLYSTASGASNNNNGVFSQVFNSIVMNNPNSTDVGVYGEANNSGKVGNNVGVAGFAKNTGTIYNTTSTALIPNNIGVYGQGDWGGYFIGNFTTSGNVIVFSDEKIKTNVKNVSSAMDLISKLNPVTYDFKKDEYPELYLPGTHQYGFIAQQVEQVIPEVVQEVIKPEWKDNDGNVTSKGGNYKGVNYIALIPVLTKGIQEQQSQIEKQNAMIQDQQKQIDELKSLVNAQSGMNTSGNINSISTNLSDKDIVVLDQNVPNPFAEQTIIAFNLPENVTRAQMLFYNIEGKLINTVELTQRGKSQLTVFANDLSNGIYTYALVVDGKIMDSKKMQKQK